jgi:hypothetical protein
VRARRGAGGGQGVKRALFLTPLAVLLFSSELCAQQLPGSTGPPMPSGTLMPGGAPWRGWRDGQGPRSVVYRRVGVRMVPVGPNGVPIEPTEGWVRPVSSRLEGADKLKEALAACDLAGIAEALERALGASDAHAKLVAAGPPPFLWLSSQRRRARDLLFLYPEGTRSAFRAMKEAEATLYIL